jgi:hypothetical protein
MRATCMVLPRGSEVQPAPALTVGSHRWRGGRRRPGRTWPVPGLSGGTRSWFTLSGPMVCLARCRRNQERLAGDDPKNATPAPRYVILQVEPNTNARSPLPARSHAYQHRRDVRRVVGSHLARRCICPIFSVCPQPGRRRRISYRTEVIPSPSGPSPVCMPADNRLGRSAAATGGCKRELADLAA